MHLLSLTKVSAWHLHTSSSPNFLQRASQLLRAVAPALEARNHRAPEVRRTRSSTSLRAGPLIALLTIAGLLILGLSIARIGIDVVVDLRCATLRRGTLRRATLRRSR